MKCSFLGELPFDVFRRMQVHAVEQMQKNDTPDHIFFCQHPPTITLGKRVKLLDVSEQLGGWRERGIEVVQTDRGGEITYHGPGQLLIYPVIKLNRHGIGVRCFVQRMLTIIGEELGIADLEIDIDQVGIWTAKTALAPRKKLGSVGLKIQSGITNHGFSVNIDCGTEIFEEFVVCGMPDAKVSSLMIEKPSPEISVDQFSMQLADRFRAEFNGSDKSRPRGECDRPQA